MVTAELAKLITEYGIAIIGLIFLTRFMMWLIRYILERNKTREDSILDLATHDLKNLATSMNTLTLNMASFTTSVSDAHKFQREEHNKIIEQLSELSIQNKEITVTLGRINGYKRD